MSVLPIFRQWVPEALANYHQKYFQRFLSFLYPYITITFHEYQVDDFSKAWPIWPSNDTYKSVFLSINDYEEVTDEFKGIKIWWTSSKQIPQQKALFIYDDDGEKRYYKLTCHRIYRDIITNVYLQHLIDERPLQPKQGNTSFIPITREPVAATSYSSTLLPLILLPRTQKRRRVFWMIL